MKFSVTLARSGIQSYDVLTMLLWKIKSLVSHMSFDEFDNGISSARLNACLSLRIIQRITLKGNIGSVIQLKKTADSSEQTKINRFRCLPIPKK